MENNSLKEWNLPMPGERAELRRDMLCVADGKYTWKSLKASFDYEQFPRLSSNVFYLVALLGLGSTAKTYLAASSSGKMCAIKFFLPTKDDVYNEGYSPEDRKKGRNEFLSRTEKEAQMEKELWQKLNEVSKSMLQVRKLHDFWCLVMPFYAPLPVEERLDYYDDVKLAVMAFAKEGYVYRLGSNTNEGLRWRHVGCRMGTEDRRQITLLDLGSLEQKGDAMKIVTHQLKSLKERADHEEPVEPQPVVGGS